MLGSAPEALVLGYLRNQRLVESPDNIESIQADWETDSAAVKTRRSTVDIDALTSKRVVTTGCAGREPCLAASLKKWLRSNFLRGHCFLKRP
ncbi:formate dehydrogenase accessory sulfurtransferase FdhD [Polynucleobacter necessarius]|uniref:formate dehydrogenase accessory sulfurtransferase FdhD n=1 Tax=Polynucleobacter necessarius TaxID=576610 RepID=UPI002F948752